MNYLKHIERLEKIDKLIRANKTGNPEEFAQNIGISRRQLYHYLDELRSFGVEIQYSRSRRSFLYSNNKKLRIYFDFEVIDINQAQNTAGGYHVNELLQEYAFSSREEICHVNL